MGKGPNYTFFQRRHRNGQQVQEKCSTSLIMNQGNIKEMQIKTTMSYHLVPIRMAIIKKTKYKLLVRVWTKSNLPVPLMGI